MLVTKQRCTVLVLDQDPEGRRDLESSLVIDLGGEVPSEHPIYSIQVH